MNTYLKLYSYANIVRILAQDPDVFANSIMVDVELDKKKILSPFDAEKKNDADFIQSFVNILRFSPTTCGFRLLTEASEDCHLSTRAINILELTAIVNTRMHSILSENFKRFQVMSFGWYCNIG